jgi:hypothetical protein
MHTRIPSADVSTRDFNIAGLPVTCMSHASLQLLTPPEREFYAFLPHRYNYAFPDALLKRNIRWHPDAIAVSDGEDEELMDDIYE